MENLSNLQCGHWSNSEKCKEIQIVSPIKAGCYTNRSGMGNDWKNGSTISWIVRECIFISCRPNIFFPSSLRCLCGSQSFLLGNRETGWEVQLLSREETNPKRLHLLEKKQIR